MSGVTPSQKTLMGFEPWSAAFEGGALPLGHGQNKEKKHKGFQLQDWSFTVYVTTPHCGVMDFPDETHATELLSL